MEKWLKEGMYMNLVIKEYNVALKYFNIFIINIKKYF